MVLSCRQDENQKEKIKIKTKWNKKTDEMIKAPADGSPVDDPAKLSATSSTTSRRVRSPVGADLGFVHLLIRFCFIVCKCNFLINNDGCGPKYKGRFYWPDLFSVPNRKTSVVLLTTRYHHHQERLHIYTCTITESSAFSWFILL